MKNGAGKNYQIMSTLATGGTAVLYKAIQTSLDRPVVIKRLHAHLIADPDFTRRFELEAKAAASLDHENIVRIIDFGCSDGNYYIVMEFIDGPSLKEVLSTRRLLGEELALLVAHEICMGLDHAHQRGIVHRDIKPANVMITRDGQVKITDFGLAKLQQSQAQQTVASTLLGTPLYMSPEQAIGESIDGRSDLFSLGTICYEAMTGKQPFLGENYAAVIRNIVSGTVAPPSRLRGGIGAAADAIVMKALSREPGKRFRSALEMARAIESLLGTATILASRDRIRRLAAGEDETSTDRSPQARTRPRRTTLVSLAVAAAGVAVAAVLIATNPRGLSNLAEAARALRESHPVSPSRQTLVAAQGEGLSNLSMVTLEAGETPRPAAIDTPAAPREEPVDTGVVLATGTRHLTLPDADSLRRAELEKARLVKDAEPPAPRPVEPPAPPVETKTPERVPPATREEQPATGFLDIAVEPQAYISVDGRDRTYGDRLSMLELEAGMHEIAIRSDGYREYVESVRIQRGELSRRRVTLERLTGSLLIQTERGAQVFVDGAFKGTVPLAEPLAVPAGTHKVELKKAGFQSWASAVLVTGDETVRLAITLVPLSSVE
jgi:serine/threonine protein kinase